MQNVSKTMEDMQDMAKSAQSVFAFLPAAGVPGTHFWQAQDTYLRELEKFSESWFRRRHEATSTAMQASKLLAAEALGNPTVAMGILTEWQSQAMERLAEDTKDYMQMMAGCAAATVTNEVEAVEESVATAKRATRTVESIPV